MYLTKALLPYTQYERQNSFSTLKLFSKDVRSPEVLVFDPHLTQKKKETKEFCNEISITLSVLENETQ